MYTRFIRRWCFKWSCFALYERSSFNPIKWMVIDFFEGVFTYSTCGSHSFGHPWDILIVERFGGGTHFSFHNSPSHLGLPTKLNEIHRYQDLVISVSATYRSSKRLRAILKDFQRCIRGEACLYVRHLSLPYEALPHVVSMSLCISVTFVSMKA